MRILSIQSSVAYGYAGNSAATFPLQRLGHEVWPVLTVHFSNHTGYGSFRGRVFDPSDVAEVVRGIGERGAFGKADVVLSGYLGSPGVAEVVLDAVAAVKAANPAAVYCCDPVMGDLGKGMFVTRELPELIRSRMLPAADVVTPNAFELAYVAGSGGDPATAVPADVGSIEGLLAAVDRLRAMGPSVVLVTSVDDAAGIVPVAGGSDGSGDTGEFFGRFDHPADSPYGTTGFEPDRTVGMIAVDDSGAYLVRTPRLPLLANGAGDVTAALFVAHLRTAGIEAALARTASSLHGILAETIRQGRVEIALVAAQEAIAHPACEFPVMRLRQSLGR
jgi:pyridoxine kinase